MPFIIFTAEDGSRLDVLSTKPMTIWTTARSDDLAAWLTWMTDLQELFKIAYQDSLNSKDKYPINSFWKYKHGNNQILPLFWVFDRET